METILGAFFVIVILIVIGIISLIVKGFKAIGNAIAGNDTNDNHNNSKIHYENDYYSTSPSYSYAQNDLFKFIAKKQAEVGMFKDALRTADLINWDKADTIEKIKKMRRKVETNKKDH